MTRARNTVAALRAVVLLLGAAAAWLARDGLNSDGIAYLDVSDVYLSGGWPASGTGYWSPLYPTLLAIARRIGGTAAHRELGIAQVVNFVVYLLAFGALELLICEVRMSCGRLPATKRAALPDNDVATTASGSMPNDSAWRVLAYTLFVVVTVGWIRVWTLTPDMLVAAIMITVGAITVRLSDGRGGWAAAVALGVLLALGYFAKAAVFPLAFVILGTLALATRRSGGIRQTIVAATIFLVCALPQIFYVSELSRTPTFSDVGRLNYLWFVADVPGPVSSALPMPSRLPDPAGTRQTLARLDPERDAHPAIYDIDEPIPGTLPIWYDAGHWFRGVTAPLRPVALARTVVRHTRVYLELFGFLIVGGLAAALAGGSVTRHEILSLRPSTVLVVPSLAALAMYALVLVQPRYVAPFVLLAFAGLVPPWATDALSRRIRVGLATGAAVSVLPVAHQIRVDAAYWGGSARMRANVVAALAARGIGPGSRIGFIGEAYDAYWARLARVRFVSLVPSTDAERFWEMNAAGRATVLAHMQRSGATAIVAESPALGVDIDGWVRLPSAGVPRSELIVYSAVR